MSRMNFVVPIGTDQEQMLEVRSSQKVFDQIQRCGIKPLQIIEEQRQRMLGACEDIDEPTQEQMKASLRIARWQFGDQRLFAQDKKQFRDKFDDQGAIRIQGFAK